MGSFCRESPVFVELVRSGNLQFKVEWMGPGLQLLAITSVVDVASQVGGLARGAVENFADLVSPTPASETAESSTTTSDSLSDQLDRIHAAVADHLKRLGLPEQTPFQIEVQGDGDLSVLSDSSNRLEIEAAILSDDLLSADLRQYAHHQSAFGDSYSVHWPPLEPAEMLNG